MDDTNKIPPPVQNPTTIEGLTTHFSYMRRDIDEIKMTLKDLRNGYVTRVDFDEHVKVDEDHEARIRLLEKRMWAWSGASGIIAAGLSVIAQFIIK